MYAKIIDTVCKVFPAAKSSVLKDNPNVSFPSELTDELLAQYNLFPVVATTPPDFDNDIQYVTRTAENIDGVWTEVHTVVNVPEDQAAGRIRDIRNDLLAESDWTQLADSSAETSPWSVYRQALRDVPAQSGFPFNVTWPTKP